MDEKGSKTRAVQGVGRLSQCNERNHGDRAKPTWTRRQRPGDASVESTDLGEKLNNGNEGEGRLRCLA